MVQLANLSAGQSFLHASAVESDGGAWPSWPAGEWVRPARLCDVGSGGWRYVSDDWTVIESPGVVHRSHKQLQLFPRNLGPPAPR